MVQAPEGLETCPRLLLADDDTELCAMLAEFLAARGFAVDIEGDGGRAIERAAEGDYALMVLDVMLPTLDGFEVLRRLRSGTAATANLPIVMLTAHGDEVDRIVGLEMGADDYLPKPVNPRELLARIRAILRRAQPGGTPVDAGPPPTSGGEGGQTPAAVSGRNGEAWEASSAHLRCGELEMDVAARCAWKLGQPVELTAVEFELLLLLMRSAGRVVSRHDLAAHALQRKLLPFDRSLDIHISKLRHKIGNGGKSSGIIKTIRGIGYILAPPATRTP